jgi:hypothetical protein
MPIRLDPARSSSDGSARCSSIIARRPRRVRPAPLGDYRFELVGKPQLSVHKDMVQVRLVQVADGKPVPDAVIFESKADMVPEGMATMGAPVKALKAKDGIYSFEVEPGMAGTWALHLAAKVQGEADAVRGTVNADLARARLNALIGRSSDAPLAEPVRACPTTPCARPGSKKADPSPDRYDGSVERRDLQAAIPDTERQDEIGAMARAVQVFRGGLIEADRLGGAHRGWLGDGRKRSQRADRPRSSGPVSAPVPGAHDTTWSWIPYQWVSAIYRSNASAGIGLAM